MSKFSDFFTKGKSGMGFKIGGAALGGLVLGGVGAKLLGPKLFGSAGKSMSAVVQQPATTAGLTQQEKKALGMRTTRRTKSFFMRRGRVFMGFSQKDVKRALEARYRPRSRRK